MVTRTNTLQGGFLTALCSDDDSQVCGKFVLIDYKSNKSKRVATSTMHAETLATLLGVESATFVQTFLLELHKPGLTSLQLLDPEAHTGTIKIVSCTDCNDLHDVLCAPAQPSCSNKHLSLYVAALREFKTSERISAFLWIDTRDQIANGLTKLESDGTANMTELGPVLKTFVWKLSHAYKWNNTWCFE